MVLAALPPLRMLKRHPQTPIPNPPNLSVPCGLLWVLVFPWIFVLISVPEMGCVYLLFSGTYWLSVNQVVIKAPSVLTPVPLQFALVVCGSHCAVTQAWMRGTPVEVQRCVPLEVREIAERRA